VNTPSARQLGRDFEYGLRSAQLEAAAFVPRQRERIQELLDIDVGDLGTGASLSFDRPSLPDRPEFTIPNPSTPNIGDFTNRAAEFAREGTVRIGPVRPARPTVDLDDLDIETDRFLDDVTPSSGGAGTTTFDADVDARTGSGQLATLRLRQEADTDIDVVGESRSTSRLRPRRDETAGVVTGVGVAGRPVGGERSADAASNITGVGLDDILGQGPAVTERTETGLEPDQTIVAENTLSRITGVGTSTDVTPTTGTTTSTPTAQTTATDPTTVIEQALPSGGGRPPRPPRPDLPSFGGDSDDDLLPSFDTTEETFDNPIASVEEVEQQLDEFFGGGNNDTSNTTPF
jgi:hypothetical protein